MPMFLAQSTALRLFAFALLYSAQGIPIGLLSVALPAWLAANGATGGEVGTLVAVTGLPWAFKLFSGPFMDRFSFPAMGRRRPWVIASQLGLCLSLASLVVIADPVAELWLLIVIGTLINAFAAVQDVAVDGMAIDILPPAERGRANALMAFGQVAGFSGFGALAGWLLAGPGLAAAALTGAALVAVIVAFSMLVRERQGERLLPWTQGGAAGAARSSDRASFAMILKNLLRVLLLPMSLLLIVVELLSRMSAGIFLGFLPVFAVQDLGYASDTFSYWLGMTGGAAAVIGVLFGPLIDRFGARRLLSVSLVASALLAVGFGMAEGLWSNDIFVIAGLVISQIFSQAFFISIIALFMGVCWSQVAATQFAIYMSLANLSRSAGAALYAVVAVDMSSSMTFYLAGFCFLAAALVLGRFDADAHQVRLQQLESETDDDATDQEPGKMAV